MSKHKDQYKAFRDQGLARYRFHITFCFLSIAFIAIFPGHIGYISIVLGGLVIAEAIKNIVDGFFAIRAGYFRERAHHTGRLLKEYAGSKAVIAALAYIFLNLILIAGAYVLFVKTGLHAEFGEEMQILFRL